MYHKLTSNNVFRCNEENWTRSFQNLSKFRSHLKSKHTNNVIRANTNSNLCITRTFSHIYPNSSVEAVSNHCEEIEENIIQILKDHSTALSAKLYSLPNMPHSNYS